MDALSLDGDGLNIGQVSSIGKKQSDASASQMVMWSLCLAIGETY